MGTSIATIISLRSTMIVVQEEFATNAKKNSTSLHNYLNRGS